jgi:exodeoxyribonuclease X
VELCQPPHRAGPDAYIGAKLMERIQNEGRATLDEMVRWSNGPALLPRVNLGKHKGANWDDVPSDYLEWVVNKSDMDRDIKANAKHHLGRRAS